MVLEKEIDNLKPPIFWKDKEIIKQVTGGLTPPMPSFEIDPVNMSNLLKYLHSLE